VSASSAGVVADRQALALSGLLPGRAESAWVSDGLALSALVLQAWELPWEKVSA